MSPPLHVSVSGGSSGGPNAAICHGLLLPISARHLVRSPFPQPCQPVLGSHIKVLSHLNTPWFAWSHLHPPCSLTFPHRVLHGWLAEGSFISWVVWVLIECESLVTSTHHATHSASLALGILPPSFFFFVFSFWFCFFCGVWRL